MFEGLSCLGSVGCVCTGPNWELWDGFGGAKIKGATKWRFA